MPTMTETSTSIAPATSDTMQDDSSEDDHHQQEEDSTPVKRSQSAPSLSKSWSIQSAHVPTYTGGKIEVCHGKGILVDSDDDDRAAAPVPFLLLPVSNDLAIVDAQRGVKMRTIRVGDDGAINDDAVDDDEDEEGVDADAIICYALSSNDQILITASRNQLLRQYNLTSMSTWKSTQPAPVQKLWGRSGHSLPITCMAFHMSNVFLATGSVDGTVRIWDVRGAYCTHVYRPIQSDESSSGGMHGVSSITWRNDISHLVLAIGRDDGGITIHDLRASSRSNSQTAIAVLRDHVSAVTSMEWCAEDVFVSAGRDAVLNTWQIERETSTKKKKGKTPGPPRLVYKRIHTLPIYEQVEGMVVLASRMVSEITVATAGSKGVVRIWKAQHEKTPSKVVVSGFTCLVEQTESESFGSDRGGYMQLKYNRGEQGDRFVVADAEHNLSFLSLAIDKESPSLSVDRTIVGHNDEILDLKIIPMLPTSEESKAQSTRIAVATNSAQVRLFDLKSFSCDVLDGHRATVLCVDVSPCGRYLATCGKDNTMRLWHLGSHR
jgi:U3 small nucleolar RNA-associated protein 13